MGIREDPLMTDMPRFVTSRHDLPGHESASTKERKHGL